MTRRTKRDIERELRDLEANHGESGGIQMVYEHPEDEGYYDKDGKRVDPDSGSGLLLILSEAVVMEREEAEAESREILGPSEEANDDREWVHVLPERFTS